jgi:hypothetical protein
MKKLLLALVVVGFAAVKWETRPVPVEPVAQPAELLAAA